jgi:RNAse (barnase) inhibitor barstar
LKTLFSIDGCNITDIPSFYEEINRVFMAGEDWKIGNLDGLNDMFHGGYGALVGCGPIAIVWRNMETSRAALGLEATRKFYRDKLKEPYRYDVNRISNDLADLENGIGPTFFEIVMDIVASHSKIELRPG